MGYYLVRIGAQRLKNKGYGALWYQRVKAKFYQLQRKRPFFIGEKGIKKSLNTR